jgi:hypothetical protein
MRLEFVSEQWFAKVAELASTAADLQIPAAMKDVVINLTVETPSGAVLLCMNGGLLAKGHEARADVEMRLPQEYAYRILIAGDWSAGMKGYVARKIKLSGNMRKLIPLQVYKPTPSQTALRMQIEQITAPLPGA